MERGRSGHFRFILLPPLTSDYIKSAFVFLIGTPISRSLTLSLSPFTGTVADLRQDCRQAQRVVEPAHELQPAD